MCVGHSDRGIAFVEPMAFVSVYNQSSSIAI